MTESPPDYTRRVENCRYRIADDVCCNARNYLRPHKCNGFCVEKLDGWIRATYPELDNEAVITMVSRLSHHEPAPAA